MIDKDHRSKEVIGMDDMKKFTHVVDVDFRSDFGHVSKAFRTVPYEVWEIRTSSHRLLAADRHRVIDEHHRVRWIEDVRIGDRIKTDTGIEEVVECRSLGIRMHMYCVSVASADPLYDQLYYTDGILSHNTECAVGYLLWYAMFNPNSNILIAANKYKQALEIMKRIRFGYESLPDHIRAGTKYYAMERIVFDNNSTIESEATTENTGRGKSVTVLYLDEFAFLPPNIAKEFWTAISPTLSTGGKCIITSTPNNNDDQFAQIYRAAENNLDNFGNITENGEGTNGFYHIKVPWSEHPERDNVWAERERSNIGEDRFLREHDCRFVTKDETLISGMVLENMFGQEPAWKEGEIRFYHPFLPNHAYLVGLDPCAGVGKDSSAIQVYQIPDFKQVAEWRSKTTDIKGQVGLLLKILHKIYRELRDNPAQISEPQIYWTLENNGGYGDAAMIVINDTGEEAFPGEFIHEPRRVGISKKRYGLNTTHRNKLTACLRFKSLLESGRIGIHSIALVRELKTFVAKGESFEAKAGCNDDLISATLLCVRMMELIQHWDEDFSDKLRETLDMDEMSIEPMPVSFIL